MATPNPHVDFSLKRVILALGIILGVPFVLALVLFPAKVYVPLPMSFGFMKHVTTSGLIYCADFDELLPPYGHWESDRPPSGPWIRGNQMAWKAALVPYTGDPKVFFAQEWPFQKEEGSRLMLARGVTNGASCFGYVAEISPKWFGSTDGSLHLNPADPPEGFLKELGVDQAHAPLLEDLAWNEKDWFGQVHTRRILGKARPGRRVAGFMDGSAKVVPLGQSGSEPR